MVDYESFLCKLTELNLPATSKMTLLTLQTFPSERPEQWAQRIGIPYSALTEQVIPSLETMGFLSRETPNSFIITLEDRRNNKTKKISQRKKWIFEIEYVCNKFKSAWEKKYSTPFTFSPRDKYRIQEELKKVGLEELERRINLFFGHEWAMNRGGSISMFLKIHSSLAGEQHENQAFCASDEFDREIQEFESQVKRNALSFGTGGIGS